MEASPNQAWGFGEAVEGFFKGVVDFFNVMCVTRRRWTMYVLWSSSEPSHVSVSLVGKPDAVHHGPAVEPLCCSLTDMCQLHTTLGSKPM